jgi:hypothetical protein
MKAIYEKLHRSWQLFVRSITVIREHPKLLLFPLVTGLLTLGIALFFLAPVCLALLAPHGLEGSRIRAVAESIGFLRFQHGNTLHFRVEPLGSAILAGDLLRKHVPRNPVQRRLQQRDSGSAQRSGRFDPTRVWRCFQPVEVGAVVEPVRGVGGTHYPKAGGTVVVHRKAGRRLDWIGLERGIHFRHPDFGP